MRRVALTVGLLSVAAPAWGQQSTSTQVESAPTLAQAPAVAPPVADATPTAPPAPTTAPAAPATPTSTCLAAPTVLPNPLRECAAPGPHNPGTRVARVALEALLGFGMGAPAEVLGAYIGLNVDVVGGREAGAGLGVGLALGAALAVAPGVWLAGYAMGGDGSFGWTLLGDALGTGVSAIVLAVDSTPPTLAVAAALPVLGAIVGYELSSHEQRAARPARVPGARALAPVIAPTYLGLSGTF